MTPGTGDAMQANKAGLLEVADVFAINKADRPGVQELERDLNNMLDLNMHMGEWRPPIVRTVALKGEGVSELWETIGKHRAFLEEHGELATRRAARVTDEIREIVARRVEREAYDRCRGDAFDALRDDVLDRKLDPYAAADRLLDSGDG